MAKRDGKSKLAMGIVVGSVRGNAGLARAVLRAIGGVPVAEAARAAGVPRETMRNHVRRARKNLRDAGLDRSLPLETA